MQKYWEQSVYSDGSKHFVSNPEPNVGETIKIRLRLLKDAPVKDIYLSYYEEGDQFLKEMYPVEKQMHQGSSLKYYEAEVTIIEKTLRYQFYLKNDVDFYVYSQRGVTRDIQDHNVDFVINTDYHQPSWVKESVFYQIFPERFCNGDDSISVKENEYTSEGYPSQRVAWNSRPTHYNVSHCLDFFGGDLIGIRQKIPYLKELGVDAIYLNPIFQAPSVHKYDCRDYFRVDEHFGGDQAFRELMEELHKNGMKLVLDISINHTGVEHVWYKDEETREKYYYKEKDGSFRKWKGVDTLMTMDYHSENLRDILYRDEYSVLKKWLKAPYKIDGWRFDVADVMAKYGPDHLDREVWMEIRESMREENSEAYILAEDWGDCSARLQGDQWDSPMNYYTCSRLLRRFVGLNDPHLNHYPALQSISGKITAQEVENRTMNYLSTIPYALWENQFNLLDSHDVDRMHNNRNVHPDEYIGAVILQFTLIGTPSVYYGDEAGIDGWVETVEGCRFPMPWDEPFEEKTIFQLHKQLMGLKHTLPALREGGMKFMPTISEENTQQILCIARVAEKQCTLTIASTESKEKTVVIPVGILGINEAYKRIGQDALRQDVDVSWEREGMMKIRIPAHKTFLFVFDFK